MKAITSTLAAALLAACAATERATPPDPWPPVRSASFGSMHNVSVSGQVWLGASPQEQDLELALRRGVQTVIDLSTPDEPAAVDAELVCRRLGLDYRHPDFAAGESPAAEDAAVDQVLALLDGERDAPVLLFCGSGGRCAAVLAVHRAVDLGVPLETAVVEARRAGMKPEGEAFVRGQVERLASERLGDA